MSALLVVYGAGELGTRIGRRWVQGGGQCIGVTLTTRRHVELASYGVEPRLKDDFVIPREAKAWVLATPGSHKQAQVIQDLSRHDLKGRVVMCGSTAIFRREETKRKLIAVKAEHLFRDWVGQRGVVLRLGGLYRDGRGPYHSLKNGRVPSPAPGDRAMPLLHYDDAATAVLNVLGLRRPSPWYTVASEPIPTRRQFYALAGARLGVNVLLTGESMDTPIFELERTRQVVLPDLAWPDWRGAVA